MILFYSWITWVFITLSRHIFTIALTILNASVWNRHKICSITIQAILMFHKVQKLVFLNSQNTLHNSLLVWFNQFKPSSKYNTMFSPDCLQDLTPSKMMKTDQRVKQQMLKESIKKNQIMFIVLRIYLYDIYCSGSNMFMF